MKVKPMTKALLVGAVSFGNHQGLFKNIFVHQLTFIQKIQKPVIVGITGFSAPMPPF
jgi:hypothetical protein